MSLLFKKRYSTEPDACSIYGKATGANTSALTAVKGRGISSIARTGVGAHTITFLDNWQGFLMFSACVESSATADDYEVTVVEDAIAASGTLKIAIFKGGTAADLQTTDKLRFEVVLSKTSQPLAGY